MIISLMHQFIYPDLSISQVMALSRLLIKTKAQVPWILQPSGKKLLGNNLRPAQ
jgi:hypothetical protein